MRIRFALTAAMFCLAGLHAGHAKERTCNFELEQNPQNPPQSQNWPVHLADAQRRGVSATGPNPPLHLQWLHQEEFAPQPAWDQPAEQSYWQRLDKLEARVQFDHVFAPVIAEGRVYVGNSADGGMRCLDAKSGQVLWTFFAEAPIRLAPCWNQGRLYFGADDGFIYCLNGVTGGQLWRTLLPPSDRRIPSNGKLLSAWPVRTGVVVANQTVYATCGIFPNYGCWAAALNSKNGDVVWKKKLQSTLSPQGYLLLSDTRLYVPNGRTTPFALARSDGNFIGRFGGSGGAYALLTEPSDSGELLSGPGNQGELTLAKAGSQERIASFAGLRMVVGSRLSFLQSETQIVAVDRDRFRQAQQQLKTLTADDLEGRAAAEKERAASSIWAIACTHNDAMVLAGEILWAAGGDEIAAYRAADGEFLWSMSLPVRGQILDLAVANGLVFASTSNGLMLALGEKAASLSKSAQNVPIQPQSAHPQGLVMHVNVSAQSAELHGDQIQANDLQASILVAANRTPINTLHSGMALQRQGSAQTSRTWLERTSQVLPHSALPQIANRIANKIVIHGIQPLDRTLPDLQFYTRMVVPGGELIWFERKEQSTVMIRKTMPKALGGSGTWTHPYANAGNTACSEDNLQTGDLQMQWFGGPGAQPMIDRHLRTTPPVSAHGRLFIPGNEQVIAMDLFNGSVLWRKDLPGWTRVGMPYDAGYTFAGEDEWFTAMPEECIALDAKTGRQTRSFQLPPSEHLDRNKSKLNWGWLAMDGPMMLGSGMRPGAARREQSRPDVVEQYGEHRRLICSQLLVGFALEDCVKSENQSDWFYESRGVISNPTLAAGDGKVFFLESTSTSALQDSGRATLADFFADGKQELVCLDSQIGVELWRIPYEDLAERHVIYLSYSNGKVATVGSFNRDQRIWYSVRVWDAKTGLELWRAEHVNNRPGIGGDHGEQVHHPVLQGGRLIAEPAIYDLNTGARLDELLIQAGEIGVPRRGGCGTLSASANALFYRDSCPTAREFLASENAADLRHQSTALTSSTRPGCWINILPVAGLVVIPEASSGCVCAYPVQTSLALIPKQ